MGTEGPSDEDEGDGGVREPRKPRPKPPQDAAEKELEEVAAL